MLVCDRAVFRVVFAYFDGTAPAALPYLEVRPGVLELRRTHSGFSVEHLEVSEGSATTCAGPGTQLPNQWKMWDWPSAEGPPAPETPP